MKATKCRCGWVMPGAPTAGAAPVKLIACCYSSCLDAALSRVWTKTGWANVCKAHYPKIEHADRPQTNTPFANACRAAYATSHAKRLKDGGKTPAGDIGGLIPSQPVTRKRGEDPVMPDREPGQDDHLAGDGKAIEYTPDMPVSDYERYIEDLAAP